MVGSAEYVAQPHAFSNSGLATGYSFPHLVTEKKDGNIQMGALGHWAGHVWSQGVADDGLAAGFDIVPSVEKSDEYKHFRELLQRDGYGCTNYSKVWPLGVAFGGLKDPTRGIRSRRLLFSSNASRNYQRGILFRSLQTSEASRLYTSVATPCPMAMMSATHKPARVWSVLHRMVRL